MASAVPTVSDMDVLTDRIGAIGEGWKTAKRLMAIARSNNTTTGQLRRALRAAWHIGPHGTGSGRLHPGKYLLAIGVPQPEPLA